MSGCRVVVVVVVGGRVSRVECSPPSFTRASILPAPPAVALSSCNASLGAFRGGLILKKSRRGSKLVRAAGASEGNEEEKGKQVAFSLARLGAQALICVLTLGFLDAGYSGDWSRIGVLSKEVESSLRMGAYGVVPFAFFLLWFISSSNKRSTS